MKEENIIVNKLWGMEKSKLEFTNETEETLYKEFFCYFYDAEKTGKLDMERLMAFDKIIQNSRYDLSRDTFERFNYLCWKLIGMHVNLEYYLKGYFDMFYDDDQDISDLAYQEKKEAMEKVVIKMMRVKFEHFYDDGLFFK